MADTITNRARCVFCNWLRRFVLHPLCGYMIWNTDMSLEIDRLLVENENLREQLRGVS